MTQQLKYNQFAGPVTGLICTTCFSEDCTCPKGINIYSGERGLGGALTNPTELAFRKGSIKQHYPVKYRGVFYPDAEAAYHANKVDLSPQQRINMMAEIICNKFIMHPALMQEVTSLGGSNFIVNCRHILPGNWTNGRFNWCGYGINSPFIQALEHGYAMALEFRSEQ